MTSETPTPEPTAETAPQALAPRPPSKSQELASPAVMLGESFGLSVFGGSHAFALAQRMANALAHSTLVPQEYQLQYEQNGQWYENPNAIGNCIIALEIASRLHLSPLMVMQNTDVIHGRPGFRATMLTALINASPLFGRLKYEWKGEPGTDGWGCRAYAVEKATGETLYGSWITWAIAVKEGWVSRKGSKWNSIPEQMFTYRAATFWSRIYAPDLLLGMGTTDELEDMGLLEARPLAALNQRLGRDGSELETMPVTGGLHTEPPAGEATLGTAEGHAEDGAQAPAKARRTRRAKADPLPQNEPEPPAAQTVGNASIGQAPSMGTPSVSQTSAAAEDAAPLNLE